MKNKCSSQLFVTICLNTFIDCKSSYSVSQNIFAVKAVSKFAYHGQLICISSKRWRSRDTSLLCFANCSEHMCIEAIWTPRVRTNYNVRKTNGICLHTNQYVLWLQKVNRCELKRSYDVFDPMQLYSSWGKRTISGHHQPASKMPFDGPALNACLVALWILGVPSIALWFNRGWGLDPGMLNTLRWG